MLFKGLCHESMKEKQTFPQFSSPGRPWDECTVGSWLKPHPQAQGSPTLWILGVPWLGQMLPREDRTVPQVCPSTLEGRVPVSGPSPAPLTRDERQYQPGTEWAVEEEPSSPVAAAFGEPRAGACAPCTGSGEVRNRVLEPSPGCVAHILQG